jgi:cholesterol transport system auxiliary component
MILTLLTSCSVFSPVKTRIYNNYVINQIPHVTKRPYGKYILFVNPIKSNPLYDTNGMAYTAHPYRVEYFAKNRWADKPSKMLQSLISKSLQNSQFFNAVTSSAGNKIRYDYILNVQLTELRQVFLMHSSYVIFSIHVEIIDTSTYKIVASKELKTEVPVRIRSPLGGVISANQAVSITLKRLVNFCINSISANKRTFN